MPSVDTGDGPIPISEPRPLDPSIRRVLAPAIAFRPQAEGVLCRYFEDVLNLPLYFGEAAPDWEECAGRAVPWIVPGHIKRQPLSLSLNLRFPEGCTPYESFLRSSYYREREFPHPDAFAEAFKVLVPSVTRLYSSLGHRHWLKNDELKNVCELTFTTFITFQAALFLLGYQHHEPWLCPLVELIGRGHHPFWVDGQGHLLVLTG